MVALACLLGAVSPGPSLIVVLNQTLTTGLKAGIQTALFHGLGVGLYAALSLFGMSLLLTEHPTFITTLQWLSAAYLVWLAVNIWDKADKKTNPVSEGRVLKKEYAPALTGLLTALTNPKVLLFFVALFSQLVPPETSSTVKSIYIFTAAAVDASWYASVAWLSSRGQSIEFIQDHSLWIERGFAIMLGVIALRVLSFAG